MQTQSIRLIRLKLLLPENRPEKRALSLKLSSHQAIFTIHTKRYSQFAQINCPCLPKTLWILGESSFITKKLPLLNPAEIFLTKQKEIVDSNF